MTGSTEPERELRHVVGGDVGEDYGVVTGSTEPERELRPQATTACTCSAEVHVTGSTEPERELRRLYRRQGLEKWPVVTGSTEPERELRLRERHDRPARCRA